MRGKGKILVYKRTTTRIQLALLLQRFRNCKKAGTVKNKSKRKFTKSVRGIKLNNKEGGDIDCFEYAVAKLRFIHVVVID